MSSKSLIDIFGWERKKPRMAMGEWDKKELLLPTFLEKNRNYLYPSDGIVGIEIEVENSMHYTTDVDNYMQVFWMATNDGSLRNAGREWVSSPLYGNHIIFALNLLDHYQEYQKKAGYLPVVFSDLCGVHVHLNVRDFTVDQLGVFFLLYLVFESSLFRYSGGREGSIFCLPTKSIFPSLREFFVGITLEDNNKKEEALWKLINNNGKDKAKYSALNFVPILDLGTVEFRQMGGNMDIPYILGWISLILLMRDYTMTVGFKETQEKIFSLNTSSEYILFGKQVFGKWFDLLNSKGVEKEMALGVTKAKVLSIPTKNVYVKDVISVNKKEVLNNVVGGIIPHIQMLQNMIAQVDKIRPIQVAKIRPIQEEGPF